MTKSKLDKSVIFAAFICAIATFVCGFIFCLSLLSSGEGCFLRIHNFWTSTRGYAWLKYAQNMKLSQILDAISILGLVIFVIAITIMIARRFCRCNRRTTEKESWPVSSPLTSIRERPTYSDEEGVAEIIDTCRRYPETISWKKLNELPPSILADYLKNEYPQVVSVVLSKLMPSKAASVIELFNSGFAAEVMAKMLTTNPVSSDLLGNLGRTIAEDIGNSGRYNAAEHVGKILSYLSQSQRNRILSVLEGQSPEIFVNLQSKNNSFEDLISLNSNQMNRLLNIVGEPKLIIAMCGASDELKNVIYSVLPEQQSSVIKEALSRVGPIKQSDIEKAQYDIINACQRLFADTL